MRNYMNKVPSSIIFSIIILGSIPFVFADSDKEKLEFAGTLEETLGHFWALEMNLDDNNSKLALVHATHPISELYDTMSGHLQANPEFDEKLKQTLLELKDNASTKVTRKQAQAAIDEAKEIIQKAREIVVGTTLSNSAEFKMQLINGLLETSKVEYKEAIDDDGIIIEMAEFQDGSAFVWQSSQIFKSIKDDLDPIDSDRINTYFDKVKSNFDMRADPMDVTNSVDAVIGEFEKLSGITSVVSDHESQYHATLSPLKQLKEGVTPKDIQCKSSLSLVLKPSGDPACVTFSTAEKLVSRGWTII